MKLTVDDIPELLKTQMRTLRQEANAHRITEEEYLKEFKKIDDKMFDALDKLAPEGTDIESDDWYDLVEGVLKEFENSLPTLHDEGVQLEGAEGAESRIAIGGLQPVNNIFKYKGEKKITDKLLIETDLDIDKLKMKKAKISEQDENQFIDWWAALQNSDFGEKFKNNLIVLADKFAPIKEQEFVGGKKSTRIQVKNIGKGRIKVISDLGWIKGLVDVPIENANERKAVYKYWEGISGKYDDVVEAFGEWNDAVKEWKNTLENPTAEQKKFLRDFRGFKQFLDGDKITLPNYVLKLPKFKMPVSDAIPYAMLLIRTYFEEVGLTQSRLTRKKTHEVGSGEAGDEGVGDIQDYEHQGQEQTGYKTGVGRATADILIESEDLEEIILPDIPQMRTSAAEVDPLFYWKFKDDWSKPQIKQSDLQKALDVLNGASAIEEGFKHQVFYALDKEEEIDKIDEWVKDYVKNVKSINGPFYLPISEFILKQYASDQLTRKPSEIELELPKKEKKVWGKDELDDSKLDISDKDQKWRKDEEGNWTDKIKERAKFTGQQVGLEDKDIDIFDVSEKDEKLDSKIEWTTIMAGKGSGKEGEWDLTKDHLDDVNDEISTFLDLLSEIAQGIKKMFNVYQKYVEEEGAEYGTFQAIQLIGGEGTKGFMPSKEAEKAWEKLLEAVEEYYITPVKTTNYVDKDGAPRWTEEYGVRLLQDMNSAKDALGAVEKRKSMRTLKVSQIKELTKYLQNIMKGNQSSENMISVYDEGRDIVEILNKMTGKQLHEANKFSVAKVIWDIHKESLPEDASSKLKEFWGTPDEVKEGREKITSGAIPPKSILLIQLRNLFTSRTAENMGLGAGRQGGKKSGARTGEMNIPAISTNDKKRLDAWNEMKNVMEKLQATSKSSKHPERNIKKAEKTLLLAHDAIRKMNNKPIYESYLDLEDIEHMDIIVTKIEKEHKMDITAIEIDSIVKSVSSYESLAKNFGVNEDVIYTVKAMFR